MNEASDSGASTPAANRRIAIMQPYFFPYIGYFQLISAVDLFVFHDDVQYIKQGWVNRNRILRDGRPVMLSLPITAAPHTSFICERHISDPAKSLRMVLARILNAYRRAPHYATVSRLVESLLDHPESNIASFNAATIMAICAYLGIGTKFIMASARDYGHDVRGQDRVIRICKAEGASAYINPIGAMALGLYDADAFSQAGLRLCYLKSSDDLAYDQMQGHFVPGLSIIDALMFNSAERMKAHLMEYSLLSPHEPPPGDRAENTR